MSNNRPTEPGPYWLKEGGSNKWIHVYVKDASHVPGWELSVLFPESGAELDLLDIKGQWAKCARPDEGQEAWAVFNQGEHFVSAPTENLAKEAASLSMYGRPDRWDALESLGGICEPVTIHRRNKE